MGTCKQNDGKETGEASLGDNDTEAKEKGKTKRNMKQNYWKNFDERRNNIELDKKNLNRVRETGTSSCVVKNFEGIRYWLNMKLMKNVIVYIIESNFHSFHCNKIICNTVKLALIPGQPNVIQTE